MLKNLISLFIAVVFFSTFAIAQPELDTTFVGGGKMVANTLVSGVAQAVAVQPDNKIVMFSSCYNFNFGSYPLCLLRLNENGSYDATFGTGFGGTGYTFTSISDTSNTYEWDGKGIALQNDGKIVVVGYASSSSQRWIILARYNSNGLLDSSFGINGIVKTAINPSNQYNHGNKVAIQPDGKIVIVGFQGTNSNYEQIVARFNSDGTTDSSFGSTGFVTISVPLNSTSGAALALQADGKIVTGGGLWSSSPASASYLLTRLNTNGTLDPTFDGDGMKSIVYGTVGHYENGIRSIAIQGDGRILALGHANILYRFNADGSLDTTFDGDGSRTAIAGNSDVYNVTVTPGGRISVVGNTTLPNGGFIPILYRIARYLSNGSPDLSFNDDGFLEIDISGNTQDGALSSALDSTGRLVASGRSATGTVLSPWESAKFSVARLIALPAQNVGFSGRVTDLNGKPIYNASLMLIKDSQIIGIARTNPFGYFNFNNIPSAQTYTLSTTAKGTNFNDRSVLVDDTVNNFLVVGDHP